MPVSLVVSASSAAFLTILSFLFYSVIQLISLVFSIITGIMMGAGTLLVLKSLESEQVSDTISMVAISYVIPVVFGALVLQENVPGFSLLGIVLIFAGSAVIAFKEMKFNSALLPAVFGNILWGFQFITFDYALQYSSNLVVIAATGSVIALLIVFLYAYIKSDFKIKKPYAIEATLAGIILGLSLSGALYLVLNHIITLGLSIVATEPALVTLFGKLIYKDRVNTAQIAGVLLAVLGIILVGYF
ncbi:MAG: DMT family transporter [Nitrososphaerota archaeon]|nr:DMT family transporter [Nitrososphaerota archaeon]